MTDDADSIDALHQSLDDAKYLLADERVEAAMNRAYYAAYHAARAALLTEDEPGTHAGILTRFSYHFIRTGRISEEVGSVLARAENDCNRADYDAFSTFSPETAEDLIADVRRFVDAVHRLIGDQRN